MRAAQFGTQMGAGRWLAGAAAGALAAYFFDASSGRRRRAAISDKVSHYQSPGARFARKARVDLENRAAGLAAEARTRASERRHPSTFPDEVLVERVRSTLGTVVSHPHAVRVTAEESTVTLSGPILHDEAERALRAVGHVRGVRSVRDELERHPEGTSHPSLQGGVRRVPRMSLLQTNWAPSIRVLAGSAGTALGLLGLARGGAMGLLAATGGTGLAVRAATNLPLSRLVGVGAGTRAVDLQKHIHIEAPPEEVFAFLERQENLPLFMEHLREVDRRGEGRWHWVASGPAKLSLSWDAELTELQPPHEIAWRTTPDSSVQSEGVVRLEPADGGTSLEIRMSYNPPGGALGHAFLRLFGCDPKSALDEDLLRLKSLLENGTATAHGRKIHRSELEAGHRDLRGRS